LAFAALHVVGCASASVGISSAFRDR